MTLHERIAAREKDYNSDHQLYGAVLHSPGYHTCVPNGTWVHETRENLTIAHELLSSGEAHWIKRGQAIIRKIVSLQDQDSLSKTYGIWSWLYEEPLDQMSPPDWNWADFLGLKLAEILFDHRGLLASDLVVAVQESLRHAAHSIFRRNVQSGYTNIAVKGGCVALAAGEMLDEPWLADYGRRRLRGVIDYHADQGGFNEYNSPTYTRLVLGICETGLRLIQDTEALTEIEHIRVLAWETLADHFHPATRQLAGPQSRAYGNFLSNDFQEFLDARTGEGQADENLLCPAPLRARFSALPTNPLEVRHQYIRREHGRPTVGTTWFTQDACLGSVSQETTWDQRRPLLGYWLNTNNQAVALRMQIMHDGKSFASGFVWNAQSGPRVLTASSFLTDGGDFHIGLDKPKDGIFQMHDLRVRYELWGQGITGRELGGGKFELASGPWRAVIHTTNTQFDGREVQWQVTEEDGCVCVDGICPLNSEMVNFQSLDNVIIASAVEIIPHDQAPTNDPVTVTLGAYGTWMTEWYVDHKPLVLKVPIKPVKEVEAHTYGAPLPQ